MSCSVWIWNYQGTKSAFGHAAMSVYGGDPSGTYYVSWWPDCSPGGSGGTGWEGKRREYFGLCEPHRSRKFSEDVKAEFGNQPDRHVPLAGLDETAIKKFWDELIGDPQSKWSASDTNCAAAVVAALKAGGSDHYFSWLEDVTFDMFNTNWWTWTPDSVYSYSVRLQQKLREAGSMP
jgi:hypothetical protein